MNIHVVGGGLAYENMFRSLGLKISDMKSADMLCFTGGADVSPDLYGEGLHSCTSVSKCRDDSECLTFDYALANDLPMVGVCRGGQFLHVMNGGKLYQHVGGHATGSPHILTDVLTGDKHSVTSTHHQMMRYEADGVLVAVASEAKFKYTMGGRNNSTALRTNNIDTSLSIDAEVIWHGSSKCLCFQPHPEFNLCNESAGNTKKYFKNLLKRYFNINSPE